MGIFTNKLGLDSYEENTVSSLDPTMELTLQNVLESEQNWNATMQAIFLDELAYTANTGKEKIYSVNEAAGVFESIKNFFKKIWAKIKALFERFIALFDSYSKSDSAFINKYSKTLRKLSLKDLRVDAYEFDESKITEDINSKKEDLIMALNSSLVTSSRKSNIFNKNDGLDTSNIKKLCTNDKDEANTSEVDEVLKALDKSKNLDKYRGICVGRDTISSSNFNDALFKYFRGKSEKSSIKITNIDKYLKQIEKTKDWKEVAKDSYDTLKEFLEGIIDSLDTLEDEFDGKTDDKVATLGLRVTSKASSVIRSVIAILETYNGAQLKAIKDMNRQAKSICVKALSNGRKNEIKNESTDMFNEGSFLSRVELI